MDEGPFRMPQRPTERSAHDSPAEAKQSEEPKPVVGEPKPVHHPTSSRRPSLREERSKKPFIIAAAIAVVLIIAVGGWLLWPKGANGDTGIDDGKYQAVFFTNGQVYFGKLHAFNNEYMKLTDIFYLQAQSSEQNSNNPQKTTAEQSDNVQLIKLGQEIHGPQDEMVISKNQVLFYENLKSDGKVSSTIKQYEDSHK